MRMFTPPSLFTAVAISIAVTAPPAQADNNDAAQAWRDKTALRISWYRLNTVLNQDLIAECEARFEDGPLLEGPMTLSNVEPEQEDQDLVGLTQEELDPIQEKVAHRIFEVIFALRECERKHRDKQRSRS